MQVSSITFSTTRRNVSSVADATIIAGPNGSSVAANKVSSLRELFESLAQQAAMAAHELRAMHLSSGSPPRPADEPVEQSEQEQEQEQEQEPEHAKLDIDFPSKIRAALNGDYSNLSLWTLQERNDLETDLQSWASQYAGVRKPDQKEIHKSLTKQLKYIEAAAAKAAPAAIPTKARAVSKDEFPSLPQAEAPPATRPRSFAAMAAMTPSNEAQALAAKQVADARQAKEKEAAERSRVRGAAKGGLAKGGLAKGSGARVDVWSAAAQEAAGKDLLRGQLNEYLMQESERAEKYLEHKQPHLRHALPILAQRLLRAFIADAGGMNVLKGAIKWMTPEAAERENQRRRQKFGDDAKLIDPSSEQNQPKFQCFLDMINCSDFETEFGLDPTAMIAHTPTCAELALLMSQQYASCSDRVHHSKFFITLPGNNQIKVTLVKQSDSQAEKYRSEVEAKAAAKAAVEAVEAAAEEADKAKAASQAEANDGWGAAGGGATARK